MKAHSELVRAAAIAVGLVLAGGAAFATDEAVVLMYHRFGEDRYPSTSVRVEQFDAHLEYLEDAGYTVVPLGDVVAAIRGETELPDGAVAITVDDAYLSVYEVAYPRLKARGWPFTVFVATDPVDAGSETYMTWSQMRAMEEGGATFANHGSSHRSYVEWPGVVSEIDRLARVRADIEHAERRLAEELQPLPGILAYPYGEYDTSVAELVTNLGYVAFGQQSGAVGKTSDQRALPRFPMAEVYANIEDFAVKVATRPLPVAAVEPWDPVTCVPPARHRGHPRGHRRRPRSTWPVLSAVRARSWSSGSSRAAGLRSHRKQTFNPAATGSTALHRRPLVVPFTGTATRGSSGKVND